MPKKTLTDSFIRHHENPDKRIEISDELVNGLAVRITDKGNKSFIYRYRYGSKVKRFTIGQFPTIKLAAARDEARELHKKLAQGIDPAAEKKKQKEAVLPKTFKDLADEFKAYHLPTLRKKTREEHKRIIDSELIPAFGSYPVEEVSRADIISVLDKKAHIDGKMTMANRIRARLHTIYEFGLGRGVVDINPVTPVPKYKSGERKKERYYSEEEIKKLWSAFDMQTEPSRSVFKMLLICGQRSTETRYMHWSQIEYNHPVKVVRIDPDTGQEYKETIYLDIWTIPAHLSKSNRKHTVPLSPLAVEVLEERRKVNGGDGFVFESRHALPLESLKRPKGKVQSISKVKDFTPHDLRRSAATHMAKLNVTRTTLGKILNHKGLAGDTQVTAIYDRHDYLEEMSKALNKWSRSLERIISSETGKAKVHKIN